MSARPLLAAPHKPDGKRRSEKTMTNTQLFIAVAVPTFTVLVGIFLSEARFNRNETRLSQIGADLRQFFHELGRHEGEIESLKRR